jgi:putative tryptophan/tyrosine transport system substrate-binding protein
MKRRRFLTAGLTFLASGAMPFVLHAQAQRRYRLGAVLYGGPYMAAIHGLREGLRELGWEEGKHFVIDLRDVKGDLKAVEPTARMLEKEGVDLIYSVTASVTIAVKRATSTTPIVFYAGTDPVASGLVDSFRKPGGRITGVHSRSTHLVAKRLELLKEMVPSARRVVTFYNPDNPVSQPAMQIARDAASALKIELIERPVQSVEQLRMALDMLTSADTDALSYIDGMVVSQEDLIINAARRKRLPMIVGERTSAMKGALAAYGVNYYENGRLAAKQVQRVLLGVNPSELAVEHVDRLHFVINLKTARTLGLTIPPSLLLRADQVIE